uniref:Uncharacterized protein n=2 Tax=Phytophthora ramorum TaxID=164328 RepID=H3GQQ5_PHYRM
MLSGLALSAAVALVVLTSPANAHGYLEEPKPSWTSGSANPGWITMVDNYWDIGSGGDQCGLYKTMAAEKKMTVRDVVLDIVKGQKCGNTDDSASPQPIPSDGKAKWLGNGGGGFTHVGPCEIYLDDTMVLHSDNCQDDYPGGDVGSTQTSDMPVDYSSCNGKCTLTIYWLAFQNAQWQAYVNCVPLSGSGSATQTQSTAGSSTSAQETPATQGSSSEQGEADSSATEAPSSEQQSTQAPSSEQQSTETPSTQAPATQASSEQQSAEAPSAEQQETQAPSTEQQSTQAPSTQAPSSEQQSTQAPSPEQQPTQAPSAEQQDTQAPSTQTPSSEQQSTQAPSPEQQPTQAPSPEQQATQAPSTEQQPTQAPSNQWTPTPWTQAPSSQWTQAPSTQWTQAPSTEQQSMTFNTLNGETGTVQPSSNLRK